MKVLMAAAVLLSCSNARACELSLVAPATTISVVISLITVLKLYDIITALTGGGPAFATQSIAMYIISVGFSNDAYGYASAIAYFLFLIILAVTAVQFRAGRRFIHYRS